MSLRDAALTVWLTEASETNARLETPEKVNLNKGEQMRRTIIVLAFAMLAPLAFAQTRTSSHQTQSATTQMSTDSNTIGTVVSFTPGQKVVVPSSSIVVQSSPDAKPMTYVLSKRVRYIDRTGRAFDPHLIRGGTRVQFQFDRAGAVRRVIVVDKG